MHKLSECGKIHDMKKQCYIVGAGEYTGNYVQDSKDLIIAADGGYLRLVEAGIRPDIVVGDFDSLGFIPNLRNVHQSPVEKDETDLHLAINIALKEGIDSFIIDGGLGGRPDLTMANYQIISGLSKSGVRAILLGKDMNVTAVTDGIVSFDPSDNGRVSVFSMTEFSSDVSISGLKYPLNNAKLTNAYPLGVSNEFCGQGGTICVGSGTLLIMWEGKYDLCSYE